MVEGQAGTGSGDGGTRTDGELAVGQAAKGGGHIRGIK